MEKDSSLIGKIFSERWIPFVIISAFGFILYFQAFFFDFSYLDDNNLILDSQYFIANLANIGQSFVTDVFHLFNNGAFYYRPMLTISLIFDYQIDGISPFIYHFTNIVLHILATSLLFIFLKKLDYRKDLAFLFSIFFLVHPALSQAVAWIPGRNDSLLTVFILLTFIFFIKYLKKEKTSDLFWSLVFFGLTLFTKESGIFILPIMFFYLYFLRRKEKKACPPWQEERKLSFGKFYFFIGSLGIIGLWVFLRHIALGSSSPITFASMFKSVYFNLPAILQFLGKIFFPFNLSVLPIMQDTSFVFGIISLILLILLILFTKEKRWSFILFGFGWFFAFLLPSFIRPNPLLPADFIEHRLYAPLIGLFIILLETDLIKKINLKKKASLILIGILIILFSIITLSHSRNFVNRLTFWKNAAQNSPHYPLAHRNLGAMEYLDGNINNAEKEYKKALELNPNEPMTHNNLGLIYVNQNRLSEAEGEYKKEIEINPNYDNVYYNLGLLYWKENKQEEAVAAWKNALKINPNFQFPKEIVEILISYF